MEERKKDKKGREGGEKGKKKKEENIVIVQSGTRKVVHESKAREDGGLCVTVGNVQGVCMHYLFPPPDFLLLALRSGNNRYR